MALTPVLTAHWDEPDSYTLAGYRRHGGYEMVKKVLSSDPDLLIGILKDSGLRGPRRRRVPHRSQVELRPAG